VVRICMVATIKRQLTWLRQWRSPWEPTAMVDTLLFFGMMVENN